VKMTTKSLKETTLFFKDFVLTMGSTSIPLHNNLSENDIREYVKKRKISGSTRSEEGRRCRDTFVVFKENLQKTRHIILAISQ